MPGDGRGGAVAVRVSVSATAAVSALWTASVAATRSRAVASTRTVPVPVLVAVPVALSVSVSMVAAPTVPGVSAGEAAAGVRSGLRPAAGIVRREGGMLRCGHRPIIARTRGALCSPRPNGR